MDELTIVKLTDIFLVPGSILVGALGVARTGGLKTGISAMGLLATFIWAFCNWDAYPVGPTTWRIRILAWLPLLFLVAWVISGIIHFRKWWYERTLKGKASSGEAAA
ncbi:MAG TPA: hypothetical protein VJS37_06100 [Terriglobales bacterium]|nr:hypothetical protein [Terriglobales bacterium]